MTRLVTASRVETDISLPLNPAAVVPISAGVFKKNQLHIRGAIIAHPVKKKPALGGQRGACDSRKSSYSS